MLSYSDRLLRFSDPYAAEILRVGSFSSGSEFPCSVCAGDNENIGILARNVVPARNAFCRRFELSRLCSCLLSTLMGLALQAVPISGPVWPIVQANTRAVRRMKQPETLFGRRIAALKPSRELESIPGSGRFAKNARQFRLRRLIDTAIAL